MGMLKMRFHANLFANMASKKDELCDFDNLYAAALP